MHAFCRGIASCIAGAALVAGSWATQAGAADLAPAVPPSLAAAALPYFVRLGVTAAVEDTDLAVRLAGAPVQGGNGSIATVPAAYVEAGYYLTSSIAVSLSGGYPPTFTTKGAGSLAPFGSLYRAVVGLPVLGIAYHLDAFGAFRPYAGIGVGYAIVFRNEAAAVTSPRLSDKAVFAVVGGIDYALTERWGAFVDVKKVLLTQRFTGLAAPVPGGSPSLPVVASVRTDPLLVTTGLSYRF